MNPAGAEKAPGAAAEELVLLGAADVLLAVELPLAVDDSVTEDVGALEDEGDDMETLENATDTDTEDVASGAVVVGLETGPGPKLRTI